MKQSSITGIIIIIVALGIVTFGVLKFSGLTNQNARTIDVSDTATITKEADRIILNVGVETTGNSAGESESANKEISNAIYSGLKEIGLSENEYSTESYNVYPDRNWENNEIKGYIVNHNIKVDTEKMELAGKILDSAIKNGANQIYGLQFTLKEETQKSAKEEAYRKASENARIKAELIAEGLNVKITKIARITDTTADYIPYLKDVAYADVAESGSEINIQPGDVMVTASVSISYGFK